MKCVLCDGTIFSILTNKLRNNISRNVVQCDNCSLVSLENPTEDTMNYSSPEYRKSHSPILGKAVSPEEMYNIQMQFQNNRIQRIESLLSPDSNILEIGSSTGHFLQSIKNRVLDVVGIELDPRHANFAREHCKIKVYEQPIEECNLSTKFDVIFLFQVFEHIQNPLEFLSTLKKYLKPQGTIYLEVPNINDVLLSVYEISSFKEFYYRMPHVYYYSENTLKQILQKAGFIGTTRTIQEYTLFNHIHWLQLGKAQNSVTEGYSSIKWASNPLRLNESTMLQEWFDKINLEYKKILEQHGLAEHVSFIGKMNS